MKKDYQLTSEGKQELEKELAELLSNRKPIAEKIQVARGQGDLSENAEYHAAKDELEANEVRSNEIEEILSSVEIIKEGQPVDVVSIGNTVALSSAGKTTTYTLVGSMESDPSENKISNESPIGVALLGKKKGEEVVISLPAGDTKYKIKSIS